MRKADTKTLANLLGAMGAQRAVTLRYVNAKGEASRRRVEILSVWVDSKGDVLITAMDDRRGEKVNFRLDRVTHYTLHRVAALADYRHPVDPAEAQQVTDEDDDLVGVTCWDLRYVLAA